MSSHNSVISMINSNASTSSSNYYSNSCSSRSGQYSGGSNVNNTPTFIFPNRCPQQVSSGKGYVYIY